ncbi:MAG: ribonuclease H-like domain-containing protein [Candidatus Omnitrophota bacterium]|nr:ribonuclease H-like domain-containing protein [Candidatus Omnitrophota bacterium]
MPYSNPFRHKKRLSLSDRLNRLQSSAEADPLPSFRAETGPLESLVAGRWVESAGVRVFCVEEKIPVSAKHGSQELGPWRCGNYHGLSVVTKDERARTLTPEETFFFDTETTGLAGGSGTVAFMVGCVIYRDAHFILHQLFIEDYSGESLLLEILGELIGGAKHMVSFNGKSYDEELLRARFRMHRMPSPFQKIVHLDLLHASRRLWKDMFADCRLGTLERLLFGIERDHDIPSAAIPQTYFDFLTSRNAELVAPIFSHNRTDLLSLIALAVKLNDIAAFSDGEVAEKHSIGKIFYHLKDHEKALAWVEASLATAGPKGGDPSLAKFYSVLLKSTGRYEDAVRLWKDLIEKRRMFDLFPYEELAKYYEHRKKSISEALAVTEAALSHLGRERRLFPSKAAGETRDLHSRRDRLLRKQKNTSLHT